MKIPVLPKNEEERLKEVKSYQVLDSLPEKAYDEITSLAATICDTPVSLVSIVDKERQWFKSHPGSDLSETSRDVSFCAHAILEPEKVLIVHDASADRRFANNPLVRNEPFIRFYAGVPLISKKGLPLGTLCVLDVKPRKLSKKQEEALIALGNQVMQLLEMRRQEGVIKTLSNKVDKLTEEKILFMDQIQICLKNMETVLSHIQIPYENQQILNEELNAVKIMLSS